jgi:hypothetical protein
MHDLPKGYEIAQIQFDLTITQPFLFIELKKKAKKP